MSPEEGRGRGNSRCLWLTIVPPLCDDCLEILEAPTCWSPTRLSRPAYGLLYLCCLLMRSDDVYLLHVFHCCIEQVDTKSCEEKCFWTSWVIVCVKCWQVFSDSKILWKTSLNEVILFVHCLTIIRKFSTLKSRWYCPAQEITSHISCVISCTKIKRFDIWVPSNCTIFIPSFVKLDQAFRKWNVGQTETRVKIFANRHVFISSSDHVNVSECLLWRKICRI